MCILYGMMQCITLIEYSSIVIFHGLLDHFESNLRIIIAMYIADLLHIAK